MPERLTPFHNMVRIKALSRGDLALSKNLLTSALLRVLLRGDSFLLFTFLAILPSFLQNNTSTKRDD